MGIHCPLLLALSEVFPSFLGITDHCLSSKTAAREVLEPVKNFSSSLEIKVWKIRGDCTRLWLEFMKTPLTRYHNLGFKIQLESTYTI